MSAVPITPQLPLDTILCGDALDVLRTLPDNSVDAVVTDPPAGISFMGKHWDSDKGGRDAWIAWLASVMAEAWRVTKPGGHALVWALPRTSHWTAMALEDAGWEIRDRCSHIFGSGFPKSLDVSKQLDKAAGATRKVTGKRWGAYPDTNRPSTRSGPGTIEGMFGLASEASYRDITAPATDAARTWDGWGTALKPAVEDWWLVRKPLSERNVAANVLRWGTGALNIGASRVGNLGGTAKIAPSKRATVNAYGNGLNGGGCEPINAGRWPANLLLSHAPECDERGCSLWCPVRMLDAQSGVSRGNAKQGYPGGTTFGGGKMGDDVVGTWYGDTGGASRYFTTFRYQAKASRANRSSNGAVNNTHNTVKPTQLMSWLITLITPPGGIVLDPFAGSGSTLVAAKAGGWRYIGVEREPEYVAIAQARVRAS